MTESRSPYRVTEAYTTDSPRAILDTDIRIELEELERRLIPLLVTVQRALGKEPSVMTPEERRRARVERRIK